MEEEVRRIGREERGWLFRKWGVMLWLTGDGCFFTGGVLALVVMFLLAKGVGKDHEQFYT